MVEIANYADRHEGPVMDLYERTWKTVERDEYDSKPMMELIQRGRIFVAMKIRRLIGFGACIRMSDADDCGGETPFLDNVNNTITWAKNPDWRADVLRWLGGKVDQYGCGEAVVRYYDNAFLRDTDQMTGDDFNLSTIAVEEGHRSEGTGTQLTQSMIDHARSEGASAMFSACWMGGDYACLLGKQGFKPVMLMGPRYSDGNAAKYMGRRLRKNS